MGFIDEGPTPALRVAIRAFGQVFFQDELSPEAWASLLILTAQSAGARP